MENLFTEFLIRIAHISEILKILSTELDKTYNLLSKNEIIQLFSEFDEEIVEKKEIQNV